MLPIFINIFANNKNHDLPFLAQLDLGYTLCANSVVQILGFHTVFFIELIVNTVMLSGKNIQILVEIDVSQVQIVYQVFYMTKIYTGHIVKNICTPTARVGRKTLTN